MVGTVGEDRMAGVAPTHVPPQGRQAFLRELEDEIGEGSVVHIPSSPVGGDGWIGITPQAASRRGEIVGNGSPGCGRSDSLRPKQYCVSRMGSPTMRRLTI